MANGRTRQELVDMALEHNADWVDMDTYTLAGLMVDNSKVRGYVYNVLAGDTCRNGLECRNYCYCNKDYVRYATTYNAHMRNTYATTRNDWSDVIVHKIEEYRKPLRNGAQRATYRDVMRWHSYGDIYDMQYWLAILDVVKRTPYIRHYIYTKRTDILKASILANKPSNLVVILSADGLIDDTARRARISNGALAHGYDKVCFVVREMVEDSCPCGRLTGLLCNTEHCGRCASLEHAPIYIKVH